MKVSKTRVLVESAVLIAIAVVLSIIKIVDLPYGGSVTVASMLPIIIIAYRHGPGVGLLSGLVYGVTQQLLGLNTLSYVTTWQSVLAVILLDYIVAFLVLGFGGAFRKLDNQAVALTLGSVLVCLMRYACHVISGCTVWAGLSIPTAGALGYSFAYNATYMVPETIVLAVAAYYVGSSLDLRAVEPGRIVRTESTAAPAFRLLSGLTLSAGLITDVALVFSKLQDAESGDWNIAGIASVNWLAFAIVTAVAIVISAALFLASKIKAK